MAKTAKQYIDCANRVEQEKQYWKNVWQLVSEYVHQRRADFTASMSPGAFISSQLWTDDPVHMAETSASAFLGYIWAAGEKSFKLIGNEKVFGKDKDMSDFWAEATSTLQDEMGDPEAGLATSLDEVMLDLIVLGTCGLFFEERNKDDPKKGCLSYEPWSLLEFSLDEILGGKAGKFYRWKDYSIMDMVEKYGLENVSRKVQDAYRLRKYDDKIKVLHVLEPRDLKDRKKGSLAAKDMPIASVHIEVDGAHICKNSGYPEMPFACARMAKRLKEKYGRGRGMNALPSIMMLNQIWEDLMLAQEKKLDPPMYVLNDTVAGNGIVDSSAGAMTVLRVDKNAPNIPPIGKLYDIQDTSQVSELIDKITNTISNHFMIDRLINMNNEQEMTAREALLRNAIRQSTLRSIVSRIISELFEPTINGSFMICLRRGKFGYMPNDPVALAMEKQGKKVKYLPQKLIEAMQDGEDLFSIEYMTPAARDLMAEEGQGMMETIDMAANLANFDQTIPANIDANWTLQRFAEIRGANSKMLKSPKEAQKIIDANNQAAAEQQQAALAQANAGIAKDQATAQNIRNK